MLIAIPRLDSAVLNIDYIRLENRDSSHADSTLVRSVLFLLEVRQKPPVYIYWYMHQYTGRHCLEFRGFLGKQVCQKKIQLFLELLADLSEQDRGTSQMATGDVRKHHRGRS